MRPNFSGEWVADLEKSRVLGEMPQSVRVNIDHHEPMLQEEMTVVKANGSEQKIGFECRTDREENRLQGAAVGGSARWVGDEFVIETLISGRKFCDWWSLSSDGQTLTMEHREDALAGQRMVLVRA